MTKGLDLIHLKKIVGCARCGEDHTAVDAHKLTRPVTTDKDEIVWTHWAPCPTNGEPILVTEVG